MTKGFPNSSAKLTVHYYDKEKTQAENCEEHGEETLSSLIKPEFVFGPK